MTPILRIAENRDDCAAVATTALTLAGLPSDGRHGLGAAAACAWSQAYFAKAVLGKASSAAPC